MSKKTNTITTEPQKTEEAEFLTGQQAAEGNAAEDNTAETTAESETKTPDTAEEVTKTDEGTVVYLGPGIRGVIRNGTVLSGGLPELLKDYIKNHPLVNLLIVPLERFAEVRDKIETAGTPEAILYKQISSEK